nr:spore cortex-lytic enzyme [Bacillus taeanensis]
MLIVPTISTLSLPKAEAFSNQVIQRGATGDDVIELQARLQYIGYYKGKIDGVFGWGTYWAVRNYQNDFGLEVDGLVGSTMKQKLLKSTKYYQDWVRNQIYKGNDFTHYGGMPLEHQTKSGGNQNQAQSQSEAQNQQQPQNQDQAQNQQQAQNQANNQQAEQPKQEPKSVQQANNTPKGFSENDIKLMANAVYGESRGESYVGQIAVAAVILNRVESASFPNNVSGVIFEPRAFTAVADGQIWLTPNESARKAVLDAINGWDPTGGAIYYFNPDTATSGWIWTRPQIKKIGKHIFCK